MAMMRSKRRWGLPRCVIILMHDVAMAAALDRTALLSGLLPGFVRGIPTGSSPSAQLLIDLDYLNGVRLADGTMPIRVWLQNAEILLAGREEANLVKKVRGMIHGQEL